MTAKKPARVIFSRPLADDAMDLRSQLGLDKSSLGTQARDQGQKNASYRRGSRQHPRVGEDPKPPGLGCQLQPWEAGLAMSTLPQLYHQKDDFPAIRQGLKLMKCTEMTL